MLIRTIFRGSNRSRHTYPIALAEGGWVTYTIPSPLAAAPLQREPVYEDAGHPEFIVEALALLTLLLSRAHHVDKEKARLEWIDESTRIDVWLCFQRLRRADVGDVSSERLIHLAAESGVGQAEFRANLTWVGGRSPRDAWMVPPPASMVGPLMKDLLEFSRAAAGTACAIWFAEALAYQLTYIHPLADGNGRVIRTLITQLAVRRGRSETLALVWLMVFRKLSLGAAWDATDASPRFDHYAAWSEAVRPLTEYLSALAQGDEHLRRLVMAEICLGRLCANRLERLLGYGTGAARKAIQRAAQSGHWTAVADGALTNNTLRRMTVEAVDAYLAYTEVIKTEMQSHGTT